MTTQEHVNSIVQHINELADATESLEELTLEQVNAIRAHALRLEIILNQRGKVPLFKDTPSVTPLEGCDEAREREWTREAIKHVRANRAQLYERHGYDPVKKHLRDLLKRFTHVMSETEMAYVLYETEDLKNAHELMTRAQSQLESAARKGSTR